MLNPPPFIFKIPFIPRGPFIPSGSNIQVIAVRLHAEITGVGQHVSPSTTVGAVGGGAAGNATSIHAPTTTFVPDIPAQIREDSRTSPILTSNSLTGGPLNPPNRKFLFFLFTKKEILFFKSQSSVDGKLNEEVRSTEGKMSKLLSSKERIIALRDNWKKGVVTCSL